jgi:hypothetical protein
MTRSLLISLVILATLAVFLRVIPQPRTIDDAFITFRYSRNIVEGNGFVYNLGVRTLGTTTPLYTLLMAGIGWTSGSDQYPWFALVINALADTCSTVLLVLLAYSVTRRLTVGLILGVLWAVSPMSVTFAVGGMETSLVILWSIAAAYCYVIRRDGWLAVFAALGILTRIDALIWVGLLMLHQLITRWRESSGAAMVWQRFPWRTWIITGLLLLPWHLFSLVYFDTLLSRSMSAKQVAYHVDSFQAATRLLQHIATPFFDHEALGVPGMVIGIVLYPGLAGIGTFYASKRQPRLLPFLLYPWLYTLIFSVMNPLIFRWYLAPLLPAYFLAILLGLWALADSITSALHSPKTLPSILAIFGVVWAIFSLNAWTLHPDHGPDRPAPEMAWHQIELYYRDMANKLRNDYHVTEDTLVAAGDIGAVGYYSRAHILDTVGLVTPELSRYYPVDKRLFDDGQNYIVPPDIIFDYQPDYIVFMESFVRTGLAQDPRFAAQYVQVDMIPTDFYGTGMLLYQAHKLSGFQSLAASGKISASTRGLTKF